MIGHLKIPSDYYQYINYHDFPNGPGHMGVQMALKKSKKVTL